MPRNIEEFEVRVSGPEKRYSFRRNDAFSHDLWVSTLVDIAHSHDVGTQRQTMSDAIVNVAASSDCLLAASKARLRYVRSFIDGRIKVHPRSTKTFLSESG